MRTLSRHRCAAWEARQISRPCVGPIALPGQVVAIVAALAAAAAVSTPESAAKGWERPVAVTSTGPLFSPDGPVVAINAAGEMALAWDGHAELQQAGRLRRRPPYRLAIPSGSTAVDIDDRGRAVVVSAGRSTNVAVRMPGRPLARLAPLPSVAPGAMTLRPVAALTPAAGLLGWVETQGPRRALLRVAFMGAGKTPSEPITLDSTSFIDDPSVATDAQGDLAIAWVALEQQGGMFPVPYTQTATVKVAIRPAGGDLGPVQVIGVEQASSQPNLALSAARAAAVNWTRGNGSEMVAAPLALSVAAPDGAFGPAADVPLIRPRRGREPHVAWGRDGWLFEAWQERGAPESPYGPLRWTVRGPDGRFAAARALDAKPGLDLRVVATANGQAVVAWWGDGGIQTRLYRGGAASPGSLGAIAGHPTPTTPLDLAASGRFAALAWNDRRGRVLVSTRRLPWPGGRGAGSEWW